MCWLNDRVCCEQRIKMYFIKVSGCVSADLFAVLLANNRGYFANSAVENSAQSFKIEDERHNCAQKEETMDE